MIRKNRFKSFLWYSSATLLVLFAVAVTLFRLYIASASEYRVQLEAMAGLYLGQPVTISGMDARVVGISPTAILSDVTLLHKEGGRVLTRFDSVSIALDPIASLRQRAPIIELAVSGARLEVTRNLDGTLGVKGLELQGKREEVARQGDAPAPETTGEVSNALGGWFLSQSRLAIRDSHITLHDEKSGERWRFDGVELELRNGVGRHTLSGYVHLPREIGRELRVEADIEGNLLRDSDWKGALYVKALQLQPRQWLQQLSWQGSAIRDGVLDMELWSAWRGGRLESLRTRLQAQRVALSRGERNLNIRRLSVDGKLRWQGRSDWKLQLAELRIEHGELHPPTAQLQLESGDGALSLQAERLQLEMLAPLLPYLPQLDEKRQAMVDALAPGGEVTNLFLRYEPGQGLSRLTGELKGLQLGAWEKLPGVRNLNARLALHEGRGEVVLAGSNLQLLLPRLFRAPLALNRLNTTLLLQQEGQGWRLVADNISAANDNLSAALAMELELSEGQAPWLALQGRFQARDVREVPHYLPARIMKPKSLHWLDNAFLAGAVPRGTLQYQGFVNEFPFRQQQGRFEVLFDAEAVELHYGDGWPDFQQLNGEVRFDGPGMWIEANEAQLYDSRLGATRVSIANFRAPRLEVDGVATLTANDGLRFLRDSPLGRHARQLLKGMSGRGGLALALQLAIPLSDKVRAEHPLSVKGRLDMQGNWLHVVEGVELSALNGRLDFTEASYSADALQAQLYGHPATISVMTEVGEVPRVVVAAQGRAELSELRKAFKLPFLEQLDGSGAWQSSLTLPRGGTDHGVVLQLYSDLNGVQSTLPAPADKVAASQRELALSLFLSGERQGERRLTLDGGLGLAWQQGGEGKSQALQRLQLRLGGKEPLTLPKAAVIEVVGEGEELNLRRWLAVVRTLQTGAGGGGSRLPLQVRLQRLHLLVDDDDGEGRSEEKLKVADVPDITLEVGDFTYDDMQFGKLALETLSRGKQLSIKHLTASTESFNATGEGAWNEGKGTVLSFDLESSNLEKMLQRLGFASVIQQGKAHASGRLWWDGAPTDISLAGINGQLRVKVEDGTITDVDPGAGRLLGILSIPALPRRLFLDFSDVFKEGLAFDSIAGDILLERGDAYTSNLQMESTPARMLVTGRTGLATQDFDQEIYVVPNVSDTATIASALAWGPQVAAVVALLQQVFKSDISAATMSQYHITGSWSSPKIERVKKEVMDKGAATFEE